MVNELGFRMTRLHQPIKFEQMDGSTLGGVPTTHVTEPVRLEMGEHWENIRFIVVERMIEPIILGLAWLDKWELTIWWEGGFQKLRMALGPELPIRSQVKGGIGAEGSV